MLWDKNKNIKTYVYRKISKTSSSVDAEELKAPHKNLIDLCDDEKNEKNQTQETKRCMKQPSFHHLSASSQCAIEFCRSSSIQSFAHVKFEPDFGNEWNRLINKNKQMNLELTEQPATKLNKTKTKTPTTISKGTKWNLC